MTRLSSPPLLTVELANPHVLDCAKVGAGRVNHARPMTVDAMVDIRLMRPVLPVTVAEQLTLPIVGKTVLRQADDAPVLRPLVRVWLRVAGRAGIYTAVVEPTCTLVTVGNVVLGDLDLVVDDPTKTIRPRDPDYVISEIE